jgi:hypothetical protein
MRCAGRSLGLADCALVVRAERFATTRLLTFDERRFPAITTRAGKPFTFVPADMEDALAVLDVAGECDFAEAPRRDV